MQNSFSPNAVKALTSRNGHPSSRIFLRILDLITDDEAEFVFDDEVKAGFKKHLGECAKCKFIMDEQLASFARVTQKKKLLQKKSN